ncbi:acetylcholinesterase-like [Physella acuta]|uniref:acetylcholinesterase-like n=1 Tax=Physella acuta TaxID=109671 RepID=UPI0027DCA016|nr:acetylcholinesterase-like [Physella acuta]
MMTPPLMLLTLVCTCIPTSAQRQVSSVVPTKLGSVQGQLEQVRTQRGQVVEVDVFWSIPYAAPPVGELRFKRPVAAAPWDGVLDVSRMPESCYQVYTKDPIYAPNPSTNASEDCLYLSIWRPRCHPRADPDTAGTREPGEELATMVWIHGGGYMTGSVTTSWYNGAVLAATECVIVAAMNYRLGALGFLFLDIPDVPGNMGLLDMTLATTWIKENIASFGGDPARITIFGHSAGAASTSLFLLSPLTRNLFNNAIIQSGSPISHVARQSRQSGIEAAREFARRLNCFSESNQEICSCLMEADAGHLAQVQFELSQDYRFIMTAVVDQYFLLEDSITLLRNGDFKRCDLLLGSALDEGTYFMGLKWPNTYNFHSEETVRICEKELDDKLTQFFSDFLKQEYIAQVIREVKALYDLDSLSTEVEDASLKLLGQVIGDVINTCPVRQMAGFYSNSSQSAYVYSYEHGHDNPTVARWTGAIHGADLQFVFGWPTVDLVAFTQREAELSGAMMGYWANFAKYGHPSGHSLPLWLKYNRKYSGHVLRFSSSTAILNDVTDEKLCDYWQNLPRHYLN